MPESELRVQNISDRQFTASTLMFEEEDGAALCSLQGHIIIRAFLIALNVATLGTFYFADEPWVHPVVHVSETIDGPTRSRALLKPSQRLDIPSETLTDRDVKNALLLFGVMARDMDSVLEAEYSRGLLLLRMNFHEVNFRREAFACFYRALEQFVAKRILRVRKFKNDVADIERALTELEASADFRSEFREIYAVRSSQVAHSQILPREITLEEVLKAKTFLDFVMFKTFRAQGLKMVEVAEEATDRK
jgi:hypothetical protein